MTKTNNGADIRWTHKLLEVGAIWYCAADLSQWWEKAVPHVVAEVLEPVRKYDPENRSYFLDRPYRVERVKIDA